MNKIGRVYIYDTTLRDGAQTSGVSFATEEKLSFIKSLHNFGVDYIEAGWPGANEIDTKVFESCFEDRQNLKNTKITAFGMTKKYGNSVENDTVMAGLVNSRANFFCIVGKTWDFHVKEALNITNEQNLQVINESIKYLKTKAQEVLFDAEHFFDGYKANPEYAIECLKSAINGGADWVVLCDTNGGMMPEEVYTITLEVKNRLPNAKIGIHAHNDTECAVANSLAAVRAGARMIQGTINGLGERCGNANLCSIIPNLVLKTGMDCGVAKEHLKNLPDLSKKLDDLLNREPQINLPYVGASAFVHKGGLHASAVLKNPSTYEHVPPEVVGNVRKIPLSNQAGKANVIAMLQKVGLGDEKYTSKASELAIKIKEKEEQGLSYEVADASFELFVRRECGEKVDFFDIEKYEITMTNRYTKANIEIISDTLRKNNINKTLDFDKIGAVNAIDNSLKNELKQHGIKIIDSLTVVDYKVKIPTSKNYDGTASLIKVIIKMKNCTTQKTWTTVALNTSIIEASLSALVDGYKYAMLKSN
jgi:2-isopropylmalate synthase